jgi:hypothetical protein
MVICWAMAPRCSDHLRAAAALVLCAAGLVPAGPAHAGVPGWTRPVPQAYCEPKAAKTGTGLATQPATRADAPLRWAGWLQVTQTGTYRFLPTARGVRLRVAGQDLPPGGGAVMLSAGSFHAVSVSAPTGRQWTAGDGPPWAWVPPQGQRQPVPRAQLFAPVATVGHP